MRPSLPICLAVSVLLEGPALAATGDEGKEITGRDLVKLGFFQDFAELNLEELLQPEVKTAIASRTEESLGQAPGAVLIVSAEQIANLGVRTVTQVLATLPGFDVVTTNLGRSRIIVRGVPPGLAGGGSDGVLVLINGQRLNEQISGSATVLDLIVPVDSLRRIEVLREPSSMLFGDGALTAVINLVTFDVEEFQGIGVRAQGGSFGTADVSLRVGSRVKGWDITGFAHFLDTSGAELAVPVDAQSVRDLTRPPKTPAISLAPGRTTDSLRSLETSYRVGHKDFSLGVRVLNQTAGGTIGATDALGTQNDLNTRQILVDAAYDHSLGSGAVKAAAAFTQNQGTNLLELYPPGFQRPTSGDNGVTQFPNGALLNEALNTRRWSFDGLVDERFSSHRVTGGISLAHEATYDLEAASNLDYVTGFGLPQLEPLPGVVPDQQRTSFGLFAQDAWTISDHVNVRLGGRYDHGSDFGDQFSPRASIVAALPDDVTLKLIYSRGFRPPTFTELAFTLPGLLPNPDLKPVKSDQAEVVAGLKRKDWSLGATLFATWVRDAITFEGALDPLAPQTLQNLPGYDVRGVELEARANVGSSDSLFAQYTYQHSQDLSTNQATADVPSHMASVGGTFTFAERLVLTPALVYRSERPRAPADPRPPLDPYVRVDLNLRVLRVFRSLELWATVFNLFDKRYSDPAPPGGVPGDYPRPGRALFVGAGYKF